MKKSYLGSWNRRILLAIANSMFPADDSTLLPSPSEEHLAGYWNKWLGDVPKSVRVFLKLFWFIFELAPLLFIFRLRRFSSMELDGRVRYLNKWADHWFYWIRMAATLLKSLASMGYYSDPRVRSAYELPPSPLTDTEFLKLRRKEGPLE